MAKDIKPTLEEEEKIKQIGELLHNLAEVIGEEPPHQLEENKKKEEGEPGET